jgi:twitching motility protein PilT
MMWGLEQLLKYLEREDISELVLHTGKAVSARVNGELHPLTRAPLTTPQLQQLITTSELVNVVPAGDTPGQVKPLSVGGRGFVVSVARRGETMLLRIARGQNQAAPSNRAPATHVTPAPVHASSPPPRKASPAPAAQTQHSRATMTAREAAAMYNPHAERPTPRVQAVADSGIEIAGLTASPGPTPTPAPVQATNEPMFESTSLVAHLGAPAEPARFGGDIQLETHRFDLTPAKSPTPPEPSQDEITVRPIEDRAAPSAITGQSGADRALLGMLTSARKANASDVHVVAGRPLLVRRVGALEPTGEVLSPERVEAMLRTLLDAQRAEALEKVGYADFGMDVAGAGRLRVNVNRQKTGLKGCFRLVVNKPPTLAELGLPQELSKVTTYHQGLAVVSGPNGHGKTTTMAALIDLINGQRSSHIITVEDPVEVVHPIKKAVISQREVGAHTNSFHSALKGALREDPDVIAIGELRDAETVEMALSAAETGHLVIATMSTPSGAKTIDRLIDMFPPEDQSQVRATLAGALKIVIAQRLLPSTDGTRLVAASELITGNVPLWNLIKDNKLYQLPSLLQRGRAFGMIRMDDSLRELVMSRAITEETAMAVASDPRVVRPQAEEAPTFQPRKGVVKK